jgi:hypothetical protein
VLALLVRVVACTCIVVKDVQRQKGEDMEQETIRARRIELVDENGEPSVILTGRVQGELQILMVSPPRPEDEEPYIAMSVLTETSHPVLNLNSRQGGSNLLTFDDDGDPYITMTNKVGNKTTISP